MPQSLLATPEPADDTSRRVAVSREIGEAFSDLGAQFARREVDLRGRVRRSATPALRAALTAWSSQMEAGAGEPSSRTAILDALAKAREEADLAFLCVVTDDGNVFVPRNGLAAAEETLRLLGDAVFSTGRGSSTVEALNAEGSSSEALGDGIGAAAPAPLFLTVVTPLSVPGAAFEAGVIGAMGLETVTAGVDDLLGDRTVKVRWHVYRRVGADQVVIDAGSARGDVLPRAFVDQVQAPDRDADALLESALGPGLWKPFESVTGKSAGGWGVTADPGFVEALLSDMPAREATPVLETRGAPANRKSRAGSKQRAAGGETLDEETARLIVYSIIVTVVGAILWFSLTSWFAQRRRRVLLDRVTVTPAAEPAPRSFPEAPEPIADTLMAQFEINWKTFSSYMQDLLEAKLKPLENSPQQATQRLMESVDELAEHIGQLRQDYEGTQADVRSASEDLKRSVQEVVESLGASPTTAAVGWSEESTKAFDQVFAELRETKERFNGLDASLAQLVDAFGQGRQELVDARISEERASYEAQCRRLEEELREVREEHESSLEEAAAREEALNERLGSVDVAHNDALARRSRELEDALQRKERSLVEGASALETAQARLVELERVAESRAEESEDRRRQIEKLQSTIREVEARSAEAMAQLEDELDESRSNERVAVAASEKANGETLRRVSDLESRLQASATRFKDLESELAASREREESLAAALAEAKGSSSETGRRVEELEGELAARGARLAELEGALTESSTAVDRVREASAAEVSRLKEEFEKERDRFSASIADAVAEAQRQSEAATTAVRDVERFRELAESQKEVLERREQELAKQREAREELVDALEREKGNAVAARSEEARLSSQVADHEQRAQELEEELRTSANVLVRLRSAELTRSDELAKAEAQIATLQAEHERLQSQLDAARKHQEDQAAEFERRESERTGATGELEEALRQKVNELREANEARLQVKAQWAEAESTWHSELAELQLKLAEAERAAKTTSGKLGDSERTIRQLEGELDEVRHQSGSVSDPGELADLHEERQDLVRSLRQAQEQLASARGDADQARRFQKALVNGSLETAVVGFDSALRVFSWNERAQELWGLSTGEVLGKALGEVDLTGVDTTARTAVERVAKEGKGASLERVSIKDARGVERQVDLRLDPIVALDDCGHGVVLIAEDVTERAEQEIEAKVADIFNESLVKSLPAALVVVDARDRVIRWNPRAAGVFGVAESAAVGSQLFDLETPLARATFRQKFESGKSDGGTRRIKLKLDVKGNPTQFLLTQCPFLGADDTVRGTVLLLQELQVNVEA